jgi:hypothetical protein
MSVQDDYNEAFEAGQKEYRDKLIAICKASEMRYDTLGNGCVGRRRINGQWIVKTRPKFDDEKQRWTHEALGPEVFFDNWDACIATLLKNGSNPEW